MCFVKDICYGEDTEGDTSGGVEAEDESDSG